MSTARPTTPHRAAEAAPSRGDALLRRVLAGWAADWTDGTGCPGPVTHVERLPARAGRHAEWPDWVPELLVDRLRLRGIETPWQHQVAAAERAWSGESVVIATGTASGKSLAYQLPVLATLLGEPRSTALYLAPTKALAADQLRGVRDLALAAVRVAQYDGDTLPEERDWVRAHASWVFTNPDMLHRGILPAHGRWAGFLRRLRYVVVDECHGYRGIFGSHVAHVLRRLRRVCAKYGATPTFVLASATVAAPAGSASRLVGASVAEVTDDGSPRGALSFALWEPPLLPGMSGENGAPVRRSPVSETARLLADLVVEGARTIAFVRSRHGAEVVALSTRRRLAEVAPELANRVAAYRAGYLPEERRALEARLDSGALLGVAATNALELGIDVAGLDAVVLSGYPGTIASLWQQAGRAGREGQDSLAVFVARDDPLDTYLVHHPAAVFGRPVEATVLDPDNPHVLGPQLCCAAAELPLTEADLPLFSAEAARTLLPDLVRRGLLRHRSTGWYWTSRQRPQVDIRGAGGEPVQVVEADTGRLLGTVDAGSAHAMVHPGAVYLHQGRSYVVDTLDLADLDLAAVAAVVHAEEPDWTTAARDITDIRVVETLRQRVLGPVALHYGTVDVTNQVVSYLRRRAGTGEVLEEVPLDLPPRQLRTRAVWYAVAAETLADGGLARPELPGAAHAAEHAAIGLLPLFATCDRWDIGGVSTAMHEDTGRCTVFVYDGHPGGAGFAARGFDAAPAWLAATREAIASCECEIGCPSCVQSPKCGNGNEPLNKAGAVLLLDIVLTAVRGSAG
ncbi:MAG TPA: DEAD/DEAH box helicase [Mycobacteriales bacterium]|nr:DEAD/DEAH box helicase [Mycobacteriales bacterium]